MSLGGSDLYFFWQTFLAQLGTYQEAVFDGIMLICVGTLTWAEGDGCNDRSFILVMTHPGGSGVETQLCLVSNSSYCRGSRDLCESCWITDKDS